MWVTLIMMVISYLMSKKQGNSTAKSAAIAAGVGAVTYMAAEPSNEDNWLGIGQGGDTAPTGTEGSSSSVTSGTLGSNLSGLAGKVVDTVGSTATSWGPGGTAAVIGAGTIATGGFDKIKPLLPWAIGGLLLFAVLK